MNRPGVNQKFSLQNKHERVLIFVRMKKSKQCYYISTLNRKKQPHNSVFRKFSETLNKAVKSIDVSVQTNESKEKDKKNTKIDKKIPNWLDSQSG